MKDAISRGTPFEEIKKMHKSELEGEELNKLYIINFLNIRTPKQFVVITLKFELCGSTIE